MIISSNPKPLMSEFAELMRNTDLFLNRDAIARPGYYARRGGKFLEDDVVIALQESAKGTFFENTIEKVSGQRFPDIVAAKLYGVEVKSTQADHWTSTGSSILESTRISSVKRIYMTFGKLGGDPIQFISRPYEEVLYGIAVTHMPRYLINMKLGKGETIFDKIGIPYEELRKEDDPVSSVTRYYRKNLKDGESLWWVGDDADETVPPAIRLWSTLSKDEKLPYTLYGLIKYPEVFEGDYDGYALWLTSQGVVDPHIRDQFSAGGQEEMLMPNGKTEKFPAVYRKVKANKDAFLQRLRYSDTARFGYSSADSKRYMTEQVMNWCKRVSSHSTAGEDRSMDALSMMFFGRPAAEVLEEIGKKP